MDYTDSASFTVVGNIRDAVGNDAILTLPLPANPLSIAGQKIFIVDTTRPTDPALNALTVGKTNSTSIPVSWTASSDTNFKTHNAKLCRLADCSTNCTTSTTVASTSASLLGVTGSGYYACIQGEDLAGLKSNWIPSTTRAVIDTVSPTITKVFSTTPDGYFSTEATISIEMTFDEVVTVTNPSAISLALNAGAGHATYVSGNNSNVLVFEYLVLAGQNSAKLNYTNTSALSLGVGNIADEAGNVVNLTLPANANPLSLFAQNTIVVDTSDPLPPTSVTLSAAFSTTNAVPLTWTAGSDSHLKSYNIKLCRTSDCETTCTSPGTATTLSGSIDGYDGETYNACVQTEDQAGNLSSWMASAGTVTIDGSHPEVLRVTSTKTNAAYTTDEAIAIQVKFSETVNVVTGSNLQLVLETGTTDRTLSDPTGSGSDTLTFTYTVQPGDNTQKLDYTTANALAFDGIGTLKDNAGNDAILTLPEPGTTRSLAGQKSLGIDTAAPETPPSVGFHFAVSGSTGVELGWGESHDANFKHYNAKLCTASDCITGCSVISNTTLRTVSLTGTDGTSYYGCAQAEDTLGLKSVWASSLNPILVNTSTPRITSVTSPTVNGAYKVGATIRIFVLFTENIYVTNSGNLTLLLATGSTNRVASYVTGTGTSTFEFSYLVQAGDESADLNYRDSSSLSLGSGVTLLNNAGNAVVTTLPAPGDATSLATQKAILIDTSIPNLAITAPTALTRVANTSAITMTCETGSLVSITGAVLNNLSNILCTTGTLTRTVTLSAGDGTKALTFHAADAAGNVFDTTLSLINDTTAPVITQNLATTPLYTGSNSITLGGACESAANVVISLNSALDGTAACTSNAWTYTTSTQNTDATRTYHLSQTDSVGNVSTSVPFTWIRDTVAPNLLFANQTATMTAIVHANSFTFNGSCDSSSTTFSQSIQVSGPGITGTQILSCSQGNWSFVTPSQVTNDPFSYSFKQTDLAGNQTTIAGTWTRSASGPLFTIGNALLKSNQNTVTFSGVCDSTLPITVTGPNSPVAPTCSGGGVWSFTTPAMTSDGTHVFTLAQTTGLGDATTLDASFLRSVALPVPASFKVNNGSATTGAYRVSLDLEATDVQIPITNVCFLQKAWADSSTPPAIPSKPTATDICWQNITSLGYVSGKTVTLNDLPFILNLTAAKYSIYAYIQNSIGSISNASNTESEGRATIELLLPVPPTLAIIDVTNNAGTSQYEFAAGDEGIIQWSINAGAQLATQPVSVRWSNDDKNWTLIAANLLNGGNGCTLTAGATGCFQLTIPSSTYLRLQIEVKNSVDNVFYMESKPLNTGGKFRNVVGRTFTGLGGSALAFQLSYSQSENLRYTNAHNFVVTREGIIYVIDSNLGILKIDPKDQLVKVAYPKANYGTDGVLGTRSFADPKGIYLDTQKPLQRLFVQDGSTLRMLDFNNNQAKTINTTTTSGASVGALQQLMPNKYGVFGRSVVTIGGNNLYLPWVLDEASGKMSFFRFDNLQAMPYNSTTAYSLCETMPGRTFPLFNSDGVLINWVGTLLYALTTQADYNCRGNNVWTAQYPGSLSGSYAGQEGASGLPPLPSFYPTTSDAVSGIGLDGKPFIFNRYKASGAPGLIIFDQVTNSWLRTLGLPTTTGVNQLSCPDDTLATACDVDLNSVFIDEIGTQYFMDRGQIRVIDSNSKVHTIFGTTVKSMASSLPAVGTVLGNITYFQRRINLDDKEEVVYSHTASATFRRVLDEKLDVLAGNGLTWSSLATTPASDATPGIGSPFGLDDDGNVYITQYAPGAKTGVFRLTRSTNNWTIFLPWECTNCTGLAASVLDPLDAAYSAATRTLQWNSNFAGAPASLSSRINDANGGVLSVRGGKLFLRSHDASAFYTGSDDGTYYSGGAYIPNSIISEIPVSSFVTNTVTQSKRILGKQGLSVRSYTPNPSGHAYAKIGWGVFASMPTMGIAPNQFEVRSANGNGNFGVDGFQEFDGAYYGFYSGYLNTLLKITASTVTTRATTHASLQTFAIGEEDGEDILYYCATTGILYRRNLTTVGTPAETTVSLIIPGATCAGKNMFYYNKADGKGYLMLIYAQNGLNAIAELQVTP